MEPAVAPADVRRSLPLLFLDVDGVLNPFAWQGPRHGAYADFSVHEARGFELRLSRAMGARLATLPAEIRWATTWSETVDTDVVPHVGLPSGLRVAASLPREEAEALTNWKFVQVRRIVEAEERPFAWLDDDALDWPGPDGLTPRAWASGLNVRSYLLSPSPSCGLTETDLAALEHWLTEVALPS